MVHDFNDIFAHSLSYLAHLLPFVCTIQVKPKPGKTQLAANAMPLSKQEKPTRTSQICYADPPASSEPTTLPSKPTPSSVSTVFFMKSIYSSQASVPDTHPHSSLSSDDLASYFTEKINAIRQETPATRHRDLPARASIPSSFTPRTGEELTQPFLYLIFGYHGYPPPSEIFAIIFFLSNIPDLSLILPCFDAFAHHQHQSLGPGATHPPPLKL